MKLQLFHTSYEEIKNPDIHYGRKNADFGQGFYTSDDSDFAGRWAREKAGYDIIINKYELELEGLNIKEFSRDSEWADYIFNNLATKDNYLSEYDVIKGPIANDTLYNTFGIITSGFLSKKEALELLLQGRCYYQIVLKTQKAAAHLKWVGSEILSHEKALSYQDIVKKEEEEYQEAISQILS